MSKVINIYREMGVVVFLAVAGLIFCCLWPMSVSAQYPNSDGYTSYEQLLKDIAARASSLQQQSNSQCGLYAESQADYKPAPYSVADGMDPCPMPTLTKPSSSGQGYSEGPGSITSPFEYENVPYFKASSRAPIDVLGDVQARLQSLKLNGLGDGGVKPGVSQNTGGAYAAGPAHSDPIPPAVSYADSNTTSADIAAIRSLLEEVLKRIIQLTSR